MTTLFRSRPFLEKFLAETLAAIEAVGAESYELVFVNDGSPDDALAYVRSRQKDVPEIVAVDLSRNFGHHSAALAGLQIARGERIFLIDCDLEVSPSVLLEFQTKLEAADCDVVYGYQAARQGDTFVRLGGGLFWKLLNLLSDTQVAESIVTERLMTRRFVDAVLTMGDRNLFLAGMMSWAGFSQIGHPVTKKRRHGASSYSFPRRMKLMVDAISSFSAVPLTFLFWSGLAITVASLGIGAYYVIRNLLFNDIVQGFTAITVMLMVVLGVLTTGLGLLGIYLGKVFKQVQGRPPFIIRDIHR